MREKEKRQFIRLQAYHFVKYKSLSQGGQPGVPILATIRDISGGGLCLRTEEYLPKATLVELKINFPHIATFISAVAKVAWIKQRGKSRRYELGLQFVEIEESLRKIIDGQIKGVYERLKRNKIYLKILLRRREVKKDGKVP